MIGQMARLTAAGVLMGLAGIWAAGGILGTFVFRVASRSPAIYACAAGTLLLLGVVAAAPAALRAMRVDIRRGITG